jgi:glycosyltransferase involved in cell wall biosynthesis
VEVHALFTYTTIPGCRFARRAGVPYVLRPLGTLGGWSLAQRAWKKRPYYAMIERSHLAHAAAIHVTAQSEAAEVRALGFGDNARVIPLGVELGTSTRRAVAGDSLRMLFLSRVHPKKGLELVFSAMRLLRDRGCGAIELEIAGDGDAEYLRSLHGEAARLGIENSVRFVGALHGDAKRDAFARADVFVLTSHNENFGIAAAEALAAGVPVILSGEVGLARDVEANGAGLVVPLEPPAIAAAIERLHADPALRAAMAERAYRYASDHLSWAECGRRLFSLYEELIAGNRHPSSAR